jgi:hypothetical protein
LQGSAQGFAEASGDMRAGMYEQGCTSGDGFDAVFAGFCAVFRRGERGYASRDVRAGMYERGCASGDGFDAVFAGFCASTKIK